MNSDKRLVSELFPRASRYNPEWVLAGVSGASNPLWITEWLTTAMELNPGMKVLDLGCGRAVSSIFLRREFGVQVWVVDLWFSASENMTRIQDAGLEAACSRFTPMRDVFPLLQTFSMQSFALTAFLISERMTYI
jgi:hypothetical protein